MGAAGALAAPGAARALADALLASLRAQRIAVTSDAVIAHAGALGGEPGVVLVAGTGVVALAIDANGALRTADGWGPWLGDEGGGAWIGAAGLRAALRAHDGRGPSTTLLDAASARFGAPETWPAQLADAAALASFAPDVLVARGRRGRAGDHQRRREDARRDRPRGRGRPGRRWSAGWRESTALREHLDLVPAAGDALDGALRLGAIHEPHVIRVQAAAKARARTRARRAGHRGLPAGPERSRRAAYRRGRRASHCRRGRCAPRGRGGGPADRGGGRGDRSAARARRPPDLRRRRDARSARRARRGRVWADVRHRPRARRDRRRRLRR